MRSPPRAGVGRTGRAPRRRARAGCGGRGGRACARPRGRRGCGRAARRPGGSRRGRARCGGRRLGGFEQRPAQKLGALVREVARCALAVGLVDGHVQAGVADGVVGAVKRRQSPSSARIAVALTGPTPYRRPISARQPGWRRANERKPAVERRQLAVDRGRSSPAQGAASSRAGRAKARPGRALPTGAGAQPRPRRCALVEQLRLQPLLPGGALIDQRLAHPHPRAQLEDVRGRDPRLRQLSRQQQLQHADHSRRCRSSRAACARLAAVSGRVGEMRAVAGPLDLLDHEPPAGRPFERELGSQPPNRLSHSRIRSRAAGAIRPRLTSPARGIQRPIGDLPSMHIQRH